jgi:hypothetical protein
LALPRASYAKLSSPLFSGRDRTTRLGQLVRISDIGPSIEQVAGDACRVNSTISASCSSLIEGKRWKQSPTSRSRARDPLPGARLVSQPGLPSCLV